MYKQYCLTSREMETSKSSYCNCLYYSANALSRIMTKMADEEFGHTGLGSSHAILLMTVLEKQGINPKEISIVMQLSPSTVTRLIEKMEYRGYLERKQQGRTTEVYASRSTQELLPKIKEAWQRLNLRYTGILGTDIGAQLTSAIYSASQQLNEQKFNIT